MKKKRIPWNSGETDELEFAVEQEYFDYDWGFIAARLNSVFHHARTPEACRRKWERMMKKIGMNALIRKLESMGYSVKSSGSGHHWVDGACGYCVCSAYSKSIACRNALALISRERRREGVRCAAWYLN